MVSERVKKGILKLVLINQEKVLYLKGQIVKDYAKNSHATKSDLNDGDEIVEYFDLYYYFGSFDKISILKLKKNNEILSFSFLRRPYSVEEYHWIPVKKI